MAEVAQSSQNTSGGSTGQGATGVKSIEQLMAENDALLKEKTSLQGSVQGLSRKNQEQEDRLKIYEASGGNAGAGETGDGQLWISREEAAKLADDRIKAWETQKRQEAEESQKAYAAFEGQRANWLKQAETEIPESMDHNHPVYKKALEIFADPAQGLSQAGRPLYPNSEYTAYSRAKLLVGASAASAADTRAGTTFAAAGGGSSAAAPQATGKLSPEEFLKLTPEQQDKYQEDQFKGKFA